MRLARYAAAAAAPASTSPPGAATWTDAVEANAAVLDRYETVARAFVREVVDGHPDLPITVSYSGGKDSLATLLVVQKEVGTVPLLFADTGFEFPETYENLDAVADRLAHHRLHVLPVARRRVRASACKSPERWRPFPRVPPPAGKVRSPAANETPAPPRTPYTAITSSSRY